MSELERDRPPMRVERGGEAAAGGPPWRLRVAQPRLPAAPLPAYPRGVHRLRNPNGPGDVLIAVTSDGRRVDTLRLPVGADRERVACAVRRLSRLLNLLDRVDRRPGRT